MNNLSENDIIFLERRTKLTRDKLFVLIDENTDFNLVLNSITSLPATVREIKDLSLLTYIKYLIFKYTDKFDYSIQEKEYVANIIYKYFPRLQVKINFGYLSSAETSEKLSFYYLVLMGFFYKRLKNNFFTPKIWRQVEKGFEMGTEKQITSHLQNWIAILHHIERDNWFYTAKTSKLPICPPKNSVITR